MVELHTRKDLENISYDILKSSKSWGKFPTPVDVIVDYSQLIVSNSIDVSKIHHGYLSKANDALLSALGKVRGIFDRREKTIYLDLSQNDQKKNFVKLHEVGHGIIPWQNSTSSFLDDDSTLSPEYREQFEAEANIFASDTLFQLNRFDEEMEKLEFGIKGAMALAKMFGGSNHAAIRRYVEKSKNNCALLVLKDVSLTGQAATCTIRDYFQSDKFTQSFGNLIWDEVLNFAFPFVQDYFFKKRMKLQGEFAFVQEKGTINMHYDFFDNSYNAFVLLYPRGERSRGRTKILITGQK